MKLCTGHQRAGGSAASFKRQAGDLDTEGPLDMVQLTLESVAHKLLELFQIKAPKKKNQIRGEKM